MLSALCFSGALFRDREMLSKGLIRLHVIADSDGDAEQLVKLKVRDAVLDSIRQDLAGITDMEEARAYLQQNLPKLQRIADKTLKQAGFQETTVVTLCREAFDTRYYDTFSLPAGVYESLRVVIGEGAGKNWWCVAFPSLCLPMDGQRMEDAAAAGGFSKALTNTIQEEPGYEIRFFLLDALGELEKKFFLE